MPRETKNDKFESLLETNLGSDDGEDSQYKRETSQEIYFDHLLFTFVNCSEVKQWWASPQTIELS